MENGHPTARMTEGRMKRRKETIVWCVAIIGNMTVIYRDSRVRLCHCTQCEGGGEVAVFPSDGGIIVHSVSGDGFSLLFSATSAELSLEGGKPITATLGLGHKLHSELINARREHYRSWNTLIEY